MKSVSHSVHMSLVQGMQLGNLSLQRSEGWGGWGRGGGRGEGGERGGREGGEGEERRREGERRRKEEGGGVGEADIIDYSW